MLSTLEPLKGKTVNGSVATPSVLSKSGKRRITITLPHSLLERLRNAVYWTDHGPLACMITDALDQAVSQIEQANGQVFPPRLSPLKRGRPRIKPQPAPLPLLSRR